MKYDYLIRLPYMTSRTSKYSLALLVSPLGLQMATLQATPQVQKFTWRPARRDTGIRANTRRLADFKVCS
jgi:hypothetical protein